MNIKQFFADMSIEVKKVDWPTKQKVVNLTVIVLLIVLFMTVVTFFWDMFLGGLLYR